MSSLVTRCPACTTLFKVVPDQLRISEGWVRCGQCDEVFDANANMQAAPVGVRAPVGQEAVEPQTTPVDKALHSPKPDPFTVPPSASSLTEELRGSAMEDEVRAAPVEIERAVVQDTKGNRSGNAVTAEPDAPIPVPESAVDGAVSDAATPSFMRLQPRTQARHRLIAWFVCVLLTMALIGQWALHERDRISATAPGTAALLEGGCALLGCVVHPFRQIESMLIESSSFVKVKGDVYRLAFSMRNTATVPLAMPSTELALTDLREQPVVRKVLSPDEMGAPTVVAPGQELMLTTPLIVKSSAIGSEKISGYRLLVFYP